jgi:hypothetical protein
VSLIELMLSKITPSKFIIFSIGLFTLLIGVLIYIHPPALYPDPSWGFQVMRSMQLGGGFNMLPAVAIDDISKNSPSFLSWWSPGQYLLPYLFIILFKVNIGHAIAFTITTCSLIGLCGWHALFKKLGFTPLISAVSIAFIACQQAYMIPFVFYNGGEILLFAFAGWFLYGCSSFNKADWPMALFILTSGIVGFFCKSSFLWIFSSGLLYLWIRISQREKISKWVINGLYIGVPAMLSLIIIYATYLSKGENPTSISLGVKFTWAALTFPLASPLLAGFSADDLTNGLIYSTGPAMFSPLTAIVILGIFATFSILLITYILKKINYFNYRLLIFLFYGISVLFFGISFLRQANISYESRHIRVIGLIITPGIIYLLSQVKLPFKMIFGALWLCIAYFGLKFMYTGYHRNANESAHGNTGITQSFIDQPTLNYVNQLDQQLHNAIFVFISSDLGLEIKNNRIITFNPVNDQLQAENSNSYYGHAGPIYIILPASFKGAKANVYMNHFPGYHNFLSQKVSGKYLIYSAQ